MDRAEQFTENATFREDPSFAVHKRHRDAKRPLPISTCHGVSGQTRFRGQTDGTDTFVTRVIAKVSVPSGSCEKIDGSIKVSTFASSATTLDCKRECIASSTPPCSD